MRDRLVVTAAVVLTACSMSAQAGAIVQILAEANLVVTGTAASPSQTGSGNTFSLTVGEVWKGDTFPGVQLTVECAADVSSRPACPDQGAAGVWFLRETPGGTWKVLTIPVRGVPSPGAFLYRSPKKSAPEVLAMPEPANTADKIVGIVAATEVERGGDGRLLLEAAADYDSPGVRQILRKLVRDGGQLAVAGLIGLIERGEAAALSQTERESEKLRQYPLAAYVNGAVRDRYRSPDPVGVTALGRIAVQGSPISGLQHSAAKALEAIHTGQALPYLAALLDSEDPELRKNGAVGLSFFANGAGIPSIETTPGMLYLNNRQPTSYATPETERYLGFDETRADEYIAFWKNWYRNSLR